MTLARKSQTATVSGSLNQCKASDSQNKVDDAINKSSVCNVVVSYKGVADVEKVNQCLAAETDMSEKTNVESTVISKEIAQTQKEGEVNCEVVQAKTC